MEGSQEPLSGDLASQSVTGEKAKPEAAQASVTSTRSEAEPGESSDDDEIYEDF
jgi:hypothetical protein